LAIFAIRIILHLMTTTMNISLPQSLKTFVDERVKTGGFNSHSEYVRDLVRKDEIALAEAALKDRLAAGLASPIGRSWGQIEADLRSRIVASGT
jgi:antitoxin ParD1/3/4